MNAYQILGIMSHIDNEMDEHSANEKIMNKVKTIVLSSIEQINQIINSNDISTEEKVKKIGDGVSATVRVIVSYMKIIDAEKRKAYNLTDKTNIDDELISVDSANRQNGKNAYQTIGVSSLETYGLNSKIAENTYSAYVLAMKQTDTKSLEELMETLLRMKKYDWAYSKIKSVNDREQYNLNLNEAERKSEYIQLAQSAKEKASDIGKASKLDRKQPWIFNFYDYNEKNYRNISLSHVGTIEYGSFIIPDENEVKEYKVIKQKQDGKVVEYSVFSNIDYARLQDDPEYSKMIVNELLSDCNIDMGMKYLSAYIGILNSNGNVDFNVDDISICQKWQEHLKRIEEESKISSHDGKQIKDNQKENNQQSKNGNDGR